MKNRRIKTLAIPLLLGSGILLNGCANPLVWSQALEEAQQTFELVSADPNVVALASTELEAARQQLQRAQDASDFRSTPEDIHHQAVMAKSKALIAQQQARAIGARQELATLATNQQAPQQQYDLPEQLMASGADLLPGSNPFDIPVSDEPQMAAMHDGFAAGNPAPDSQQQIQAEIQSLSDRLHSLQARLQGSQPLPYPSAPQLPVTSIPAMPSGLIEQQVDAHQHKHNTMPVPNTSYQIQHNVRMQQAYRQNQHEPASAQPTQHHHAAVNAMQPSLPTSLQQTPMHGYQQTIVTASMPAPSTVAPLQLANQLKAMSARPTNRGMALTLGERYFDNNSARLWGGRAARHLDNVARVMKSNPGLSVDVEAHTDAAGTRQGNQDLSADRAIAVKSALVLRGVEPKRIRTTGYGGTRPATSGAGELSRLKNRRVELIFPEAAIPG